MGGGTLQSTLQVKSMPAYVRKKTLNPGRKIEYIHARLVGKFSDVQFGICFLTLNVGYMLGKWCKISETFKRR